MKPRLAYKRTKQSTNVSAFCRNQPIQNGLWILGSLLFALSTCLPPSIDPPSGSKEALLYPELFCTLLDTCAADSSNSSSPWSGLIWSPSAGRYGSNQSVAISMVDPSELPGGIICYTDDGSSPICNTTPACSSGNEVTGNIIVSSEGDTTLKMVACNTDTTHNTAQSVTYTIDTTGPDPITNFMATHVGDGKLFLTWIKPTDSDLHEIKIVQKVNSAPTGPTDGTEIYAGIGSSTFLTGLNNGDHYYFAAYTYDDLNNTDSANVAYADGIPLGDAAGAPMFTPLSQKFGPPSIFVALTTSTTGSPTICYTTDGSNPTCDISAACTGSATAYTPAISVNATTTIKAITCRSDLLASAVSSATYTFDNTPPAAPTGFIDTVGSEQITLQWVNPPDADFNHVVVRRDVGTPPATSSAGTLVYSGPLQKFVDKGLTNGTNYGYSIWAYDDVNNESARATLTATPRSCGGLNPCRIFVSNGHNGNFGGIAGADEWCDNDPNRPTGPGSYKALLSDGSTRLPPDESGGPQDWVLKPATPYFNPDNIIVPYNTTELFSRFVQPFNFTGSGLFTWTGLTVTGGSGLPLPSPGTWESSPNNCNGWTSSTTAYQGTYGKADSGTTNNQAFTNSPVNCSATIYRLYCVEQ